MILQNMISTAFKTPTKKAVLPFFFRTLKRSNQNNTRKEYKIQSALPVIQANLHKELGDKDF